MLTLNYFVYVILTFDVFQMICNCMFRFHLDYKQLSKVFQHFQSIFHKFVILPAFCPHTLIFVVVILMLYSSVSTMYINLCSGFFVAVMFKNFLTFLYILPKLVFQEVAYNYIILVFKIFSLNLQFNPYKDFINVINPLINTFVNKSLCPSLVIFLE